MEIKYLKNHEIDKEKWDYCISKSFNGIVYAYSWYLDIVSENWEALIDGDYLRVFPLPVKRKYGIDLIYQPFFTQQLGIISQSILTQEVVQEFIKAIPKKFKYVEIHLNTFNKIDGQEFSTKPLLNHELDLINSHKNISKKYSENLKRKLQKTLNSGLFLNPNSKPDEIINLFRQNKGRRIHHLKDENYIILKRLIYTAIHRGMAQVYGVYNTNNELCAGAFFLLGNRKLTFLFSGLSEEGRGLNASAYLIDQVIQMSQSKHLTFDFEGSNEPGLARFYKSFGSKEINYYILKINKLNPVYHLGMRLSRKIRSISS
jgi:hypothetical protein